MPSSCEAVPAVYLSFSQERFSPTDEWKTFKKDFTADWAKHGWSGKAGCTVRFDVGDGAGVTLKVRNMRWQPVP